MFYNRHTRMYDDITCKTQESTRCVKMDCHEPTTHFSLLGFFKEPKYDQWMEQLFKHLGDCVWDDEEYMFMQEERLAWPVGCTKTIFSDTRGNPIFYDLKPEQYGSMSLGLYTDKDCILEYSGNYTAEYVLKTMVCGGYVWGGNDYSYLCQGQNYTGTRYDHDGNPTYYYSNIWRLDDHLQKWNNAFDVYKICQPCKAYDLTNIITPNGKSNRYNYTGRRHYYSDNKYNNNHYYDRYKNFNCHDDADYYDVNQVSCSERKTSYCYHQAPLLIFRISVFFFFSA